MAVTKIWPIRDSIGRVVEYAKNPEKTELSDIQRVLHYAANEEKTATSGERQLYVTGVNCDADTAFQEMLAVQQRFDKTTGNVAYHAYQSFKTGEVTPEQCHRLGVELARKMWGDQYQVLVATHFNTGTYHNHFVVNAVGMWTGKKFNCCKGAYWKFRSLSDELCQAENLTVIRSPVGQTPRKLYFAEKNGDPTRYNLMRQAIDRALLLSVDPSGFLRTMKKQGYAVDLNPRHKYVTIRSVNSKKSTRLYRLGEDYNWNALCIRMKENAAGHYLDTMQNYCQFMGSRPAPLRRKHCRLHGSLNAAGRITGLRALYLHYCYLLGVYPRYRQRRPLSPEMREACRRLEHWAAQADLVWRHRLDSPDAVCAHIEKIDTQMQLIDGHRQQLRRELARKHTPKEKCSLAGQRDICTRDLARLRKERRTAESILAEKETLLRLVRTEQRMQLEQQRSRQKTRQKGLVR